MADTDARIDLLDAALLERAEDIFHEVAALDRAAWEAAAADRCAGNSSLHRLVMRLLQCDGCTSDDALRAILNVRNVALDADTEEPVRIGDFAVTRPLGEGGMGAVYEARQESPHRRVAIKLIRPGMATRQLIRRVEHEADVLARLNHPGIAQVYQAGYGPVTFAGGATASLPYIVMEYVEGATFAQYVRTKALPHADRLELLAKVCDAVEHAHRRGIIHRDLKPANVLVTESGQVKVLDFGVARDAAVGEQTQTLHTSPGQIVGTLAYMSPEQVSGTAADLDTRSDVYALGVMLYEALTGRLPLDAADAALPAMIRRIQEETPAAVSAHSPQCRGDVDTIVAKSLAKDRMRRYQSAAALADDIRRHLRGEPIEARRDSTWYVLTRTARRYRAIVSLAAVIVVLIASTAVVLGLQLHRERLLRADLKLQKDRADVRFADVRRLANSFLFEFHDAILNLPGSTAAREKVVSTALEYLRTLAADAGDDPSLLLEVAIAYQRVAEAQYSDRHPSLGRADEARTSLQESERLLSQLIREHPQEPEYRFHRAVTLEQMSNLRTEADDFETMYALRDEALAIVDNLLEADPGNRPYRLWLVDAHLNRLHQGTGFKIQEAQRHQQELQRVADLLQPILAESPDDPDVMRRRALLHIRTGTLHAGILNDHELVDRERALQEYEQARDIFAGLLARDPENATCQRDVCAAHSSLATLLNRLDRPTDMVAELEAAIPLAELAVARDANDARARLDLAALYSQLAAGLTKLHQHDRAAAALQRTVELYADLCRIDPSNGVRRMQLANQNLRLATALEELQRPAEAAEALESALDSWADESLNDLLDNPVYSKWPLQCADKLATIYTAAGQHEPCARTYRRVADILLRTGAAGPNDARRALAADALERLGDALRQQA